jgi:hypothetical protein
MAELDLVAYKASLKAAAETKRDAIKTKPVDDPERLARVKELQAKWDGLKAQEAEIGAKLAEDPTARVDDNLLKEIDRLKQAVSAELTALGVTVS